MGMINVSLSWAFGTLAAFLKDLDQKCISRLISSLGHFIVAPFSLTMGSSNRIMAISSCIALVLLRGVLVATAPLCCNPVHTYSGKCR